MIQGKSIKWRLEQFFTDDEIQQLGREDFWQTRFWRIWWYFLSPNAQGGIQKIHFQIHKKIIKTAD